MTNEELTHLCCPLCGKKVFPSESVTVVSFDQARSSPSPGDATVCTHCTEILIFNKELRLASPTTEELNTIKEDPDWPLMEKCVKFARKLKSKEEESTSFSV